VKYWEIILENLRNAGWNCGSMATTDGKGRPIWVVAAERSDAGRFIVHTDQELPAFLELESAIKTHRHNQGCPLDAELGDYRGQSQQSRMELGLRISFGFRRTNDLDCIAMTEGVSLCTRRKSWLRF
jgi:hypothetical protein